MSHCTVLHRGHLLTAHNGVRALGLVISLAVECMIAQLIGGISAQHWFEGIPSAGPVAHTAAQRSNDRGVVGRTARPAVGPFPGGACCQTWCRRGARRDIGPAHARCAACCPSR